MSHPQKDKLTSSSKRGAYWEVGVPAVPVSHPLTSGIKAILLHVTPGIHGFLGFGRSLASTPKLRRKTPALVVSPHAPLRSLHSPHPWPTSFLKGCGPRMSRLLSIWMAGVEMNHPDTTHGTGPSKFGGFGTPPKPLRGYLQTPLGRSWSIYIYIYIRCLFF